MRATVTEKFLSKIRRLSYRRSYVANEVRMSLAHQIKALREQRGWSQSDLAGRMGTTQSVVSRLEDPDYGRVSLKTILQVADAFDVAFVARYCSFGEMIFRNQDVSPSAFEAPSFEEDELRVSVLPESTLQIFAPHSAPTASQTIIQLGAKSLTSGSYNMSHTAASRTELAQI